MITSNNYTVYGIKDDAERYFWAGYHILVLLSSFIGDSLILIASARYNAFKLHGFIVAVIQHIAVSDLIISAFLVLPTGVSLVTSRWVFGDALCYLKPYLTYYCYPTGMALISALTTSKLMLLKYPLRSASWSRKRAHVVCGVIWACLLYVPASCFLVDKDDVTFDYRSYSCSYNYSSKVWRWLRPIVVTLCGFLPNLVVIGTTIPTLRYLVESRRAARRGKGSIRWQGLLTVLLTAFVFCISTLPLTVYYTARDFVNEDPPGFFHIHFYRIGAYCGLINVMANFFIYSLTVISFRRFLWSRVLLMTSYLAGTISGATSTLEEQRNTAQEDAREDVREDKINIRLVEEQETTL